MLNNTNTKIKFEFFIKFFLLTLKKILTFSSIILILSGASSLLFSEDDESDFLKKVMEEKSPKESSNQKKNSQNKKKKLSGKKGIKNKKTQSLQIEKPNNKISKPLSNNIPSTSKLNEFWVKEELIISDKMIPGLESKTQTPSPESKEVSNATSVKTEITSNPVKTDKPTGLTTVNQNKSGVFSAIGNFFKVNYQIIIIFTLIGIFAVYRLKFGTNDSRRY